MLRSLTLPTLAGMGPLLLVSIIHDNGFVFFALVTGLGDERIEIPR